MEKSISGLERDLYTGFFYVSTEGSTGFSSISTKWQTIVSECMQFSAQGDILLLGDFNGRTSLLIDVPDVSLDDLADIPARSSKYTSVNSYDQYLIYVLGTI